MKNASHRLAEDICKLYIWQGLISRIYNELEQDLNK